MCVLCQSFPYVHTPLHTAVLVFLVESRVAHHMFVSLRFHPPPEYIHPSPANQAPYGSFSITGDTLATLPSQNLNLGRRDACDVCDL